MSTVSATHAKQNFAAILDAAQREPVRIRRHEREVAVLVSVEEFERLHQNRWAEFNRLSAIAANSIRACRDARDDKLLELAVDGRTDLIVTGDLDLLELHPFRGIAILTPNDYLQRE
jgi:prevent-host-death family protein